MEDREQQETLYKLSLFEQQMNQLNSQLEAIEKASMDMASLIQGLEELKGEKDKEILAPIGRGIFAKAKLISEDLIVDIGDKNLIQKDINGTKELIQEQIKKLDFAKEEINKSLNNINQEILDLISRAQEKENSEGKSRKDN